MFATNRQNLVCNLPSPVVAHGIQARATKPPQEETYINLSRFQLSFHSVIMVMLVNNPDRPFRRRCRWKERRLHDQLVER